MSFAVRSEAFTTGTTIPSRYTCDGENVSPRLEWNEAPDHTATFALIVDDPDAPRGVFTHWVLFNLPASIRSLPEKVPGAERLPDGGVQGHNDRDNLGYTGPCPPPGNPHHYRFTLYALDTSLSVPPGASKQQVLQAMEGHILGQAQLVGTYQRKGR